MPVETIATALHESALSQALRASVWVYPLINTGHVLGIAMLFGAIAPLDLRLLGCWKRVPLEPLARILLPMAVIGLALAAVTGALLFTTRPLDYIVVPLFGLKLALILAAVVNALLLRRSPAWKLLRFDDPHGAPRLSWRIAAGLSLLLWLGVITAGRLIGYR
jgi:hypothetical protein